MVRRVAYGYNVLIHSNRICHKTVKGKIGQMFCLFTDWRTGNKLYDVTVNGKSYTFYPKEIEPLEGEEEWDDII